MQQFSIEPPASGAELTLRGMAEAATTAKPQSQLLVHPDLTACGYSGLPDTHGRLWPQLDPEPRLAVTKQVNMELGG